MTSKIKTKTLLFLLLVIVVPLGYSQETLGKIQGTNNKSYELPYILIKPKNDTTPKPLLIFLHGSGEKGTDLNKVRQIGPVKYVQSHTIDAYILAPQCPENEYWNTESLYQLIQKVTKENPIDQNRIYLTGLSMGAWGAWNLAVAHPELFAAFVPIAGYIDRIPMLECCKLSTIPIRMYHGLQDDVVNIYYSKTMYERLKKCNANVTLDINKEAKHDSWVPVYNDPKLYEWLLQQKK